MPRNRQYPPKNPSKEGTPNKNKNKAKCAPKKPKKKKK